MAEAIVYTIFLLWCGLMVFFANDPYWPPWVIRLLQPGWERYRHSHCAHGVMFSSFGCEQCWEEHAKSRQSFYEEFPELRPVLQAGDLYDASVIPTRCLIEATDGSFVAPHYIEGVVGVGRKAE